MNDNESKLVIIEDDDESLTKLCSKTVWNQGPFAQIKQVKEEPLKNLTPIEKLCLVDEVVDELDDLYEKLKPQFSKDSKTKITTQNYNFKQLWENVESTCQKLSYLKIDTSKLNSSLSSHWSSWHKNDSSYLSNSISDISRISNVTK